MPLWEIPGKVREFDEDWRVAALCFMKDDRQVHCNLCILLRYSVNCILQCRIKTFEALAWCTQNNEAP